MPPGYFHNSESTAYVETAKEPRQQLRLRSVNVCSPYNATRNRSVCLLRYLVVTRWLLGIKTDVLVGGKKFVCVLTAPNTHIDKRDVAESIILGNKQQLRPSDVRFSV